MAMHLVVDCRSIHRHMGGIGRAALHLVEALGAAGGDRRVSALIGANPPDSLSLSGVDIHQVEAAMIDEAFDQFGLPGVLEDLQADVYLNSTFSVPALKTTRVQMSIIHDIVFEDHPEWVEPGLRDYLRRWSRFAAGHADRVVTVSDHARERIRAAYGTDPAKVVRIYNGIASSCFEPPDIGVQARLRVRHSIHRPYILYLGTLEPKKGVPELIAAFGRLSATGMEVELVLAGGRGGPEFDLEEAIAATGRVERVRVLGYVDETDKKDLLAGCALFVYPSHYEGFGLPPLEAMALGAPTLVNDATSLPEVVGDAALKVNVGDRDAFAQALDRGLRDDGFKKRAQVAGPAQARRFSWEHAAGHVWELCEGLISSRN
jgi:glycosyltransferase involved in cell wall biosynthesis